MSKQRQQDPVPEFWHLQVEEARQRYQIQRGLTPHQPDIFNTSGQAIIPSPMPLQHTVNGIQNAASGAGQWQQVGNNPPFYTGASKVGSTIVEYNDLDDTSLTVDVWEQIKSFTDLDVDVLLAILAQVLTGSGERNRHGTWIYASQVLDYRGIQPRMQVDAPGGPKRRAGHRQEDINDITHCMRRLSNLWIMVHQEIREEVPARTTKGRKKKPKIKETSTRSRLLNITSMVYQRELHHEPIPPDATPVGWHVLVGEWIEPFLADANRQLGFLCQTALKYDPYREQWEKRLARYFLFHMRMNGRLGMFKREIGPLLEMLTLPVNYRDPERTKQRFEKAMNRLVEDKQLDEWEYDEEITLPSRGWLPTWLQRKIKIYFAPYKPNSSTKTSEEYE